MLGWEEKLDELLLIGLKKNDFLDDLKSSRIVGGDSHFDPLVDGVHEGETLERVTTHRNIGLVTLHNTWWMRLDVEQPLLQDLT